MGLHLIIATHALGHLPSVIESIRRSPLAPATMVVTCDGVRADLADYLRSAWPRLPAPAILVQRPHKGVARRGQTRNNGVRAIRARLQPADMLYFLDGDICLDTRHFSALAALRRCSVVIGRVQRLSAAATARLERRLQQGLDCALPLAQRLAYARKVAKAKATCWLRRLACGPVARGIPPYWPDLRSGNCAVRAEDFFRVNGFDESMLGWGFEDSDLGLRLYRAGARVTTFPWGCTAYHLWHAPAGGATPQPRPARWAAATGYRTPHGLDAAFDQAESELQITG